MRNATMTTATVAIGLALTGCATNPYGSSSNNSGNRALVGAGAGAVAGALVGAAVGDPVSGAAVGAVAGGVVGAVVKPSGGPRVYRRDTSGACYYVDKRGRTVYDPQAKC
jgi:outer membrane lipoprotein SlyB